MIVTEIKSNLATVRIHDEYCGHPTQGRISHMNQIVSNAYKRRSISSETQNIKDQNNVLQ